MLKSLISLWLNLYIKCSITFLLSEKQLRFTYLIIFQPHIWSDKQIWGLQGNITDILVLSQIILPTDTENKLKTIDKWKKRVLIKSLRNIFTNKSCFQTYMYHGFQTLEENFHGA